MQFIRQLFGQCKYTWHWILFYCWWSHNMELEEKIITVPYCLTSWEKYQWMSRELSLVGLFSILTLLMVSGKNKKKNIFILAAIMCLRHGIFPTHPNHTYYFAMGSSKEGHTEVINHYVKQINNYKMKDEILKSKIKTNNTLFDMLTYIIDRLEWQVIFHKLKEVNYSRQWGYASRIKNSYSSKPHILFCNWIVQRRHTKVLNHYVKQIRKKKRKDEILQSKN